MAAQVQIGNGPAPALDPRRRFGNRGENLAAVFLLSKGYSVIARNWDCRAGEIDLICERQGVVHFIEVKTRKSLEYGHPEEAVTATKLKHLRHAVELYLQSTKSPPRNYQIDVLAILVVPGQAPQFHFIENVA